MKTLLTVLTFLFVSCTALASHSTLKMFESIKSCNAFYNNSTAMTLVGKYNTGRIKHVVTEHKDCRYSYDPKGDIGLFYYTSNESGKPMVLRCVNLNNTIIGTQCTVAKNKAGDVSQRNNSARSA
ncbi:MAG: hypothetical protein P1U63_09510 [Coxiellaceae bacterium]|nr:hypothetical protein [Coxiellaceae bacterium]